MSLFNNKYRIESTRLPFYDYSMPGYYFVTVCVQGGHYYFGQVENKKMKLSKLGRAVGKYWQEIPKHFPFVKLDEFMVMPNHIHGIIIIMKKTQHVET
ncbi:TPA: transposase, partial [Candidatus Komeilibacteria bacterium]|nr:transposase [Candidatus Komeilibacteria bacterium]